MRSATILNDQVSPSRTDWLSNRLAFGLTPARLILLGLIALSAFLHFYQLDEIGDANQYYTAAVESMLQSWENFFFVAAEPGGSVTIDKPPLGLWIEAASAFIFGVNGFAVVLPNILAGLISIPLMYYLVKKYFSTSAGLIAAAVIALTPVSIAAQRNNTMDGMLTLVLLLAAWAFLQATETNRLRFLWLGAVLVGLGFNIKMLQAFLPVPAFYAVYFLGGRAGWARKALHLVGATILLLGVSLSWAIAVDLTPAEERPYIGSSTDNTVMELILGHNGLNRLLGGRGGGLLASNNTPADDGLADGQPSQPRPAVGDQPAPRPGQQPPGGGQPGQQPPAGGQPGQFGPPPGGAPQQGQPGQFGPPAGGDQGQVNPPAGPAGQDGRAGGGGPGTSGEVGQQGWQRFLVAPLSKEMSWLLPFALLAGLVILFRHRLSLPLGREHRFALMWGGWLGISLIFFSAASLFHAYYLVMLAPPLAALVGGGAAELNQWRQENGRLAAGLLTAIALVTLLYQLFNAQQFVDAWWVWLPLLLLPLSVAGVWWSWGRRNGRYPQAALALLMANLLLIPLAWSYLTTTLGNDINLPGAYEGQTETAQRPGDGQRTADEALITYLEANTQDSEYLLAVPSSMQGAQLVLATGRPVLYMGGFNGSDPVISADQLAQMVVDDDLRYIMLGGGRNGQMEISNWVQSTCEPVSEFSTGQNNQGVNGRPGPNQGSTLYQCG